MGKDRDKQRTKGNLKPSSSGRAAALVTKDGSLGFMGFDGQGSANLGYVPMTTSPGDEVDGTVDGSFRMVMRKLTKRDSLTKYKALQEFSELCKSSKSEDVEGVLPFWPRLYNKLSMDIDQRVREATQEAMFQIVQRVGRNLAPHLKSVIGTWLCAQFDSYAPVASAAQRAFQAAFSDAKQVEALMFCRVGLCEFLEDNILRQTAETLSDPKIVSKEDSESKYNRVVSSSMLALGYLMSVSSDDINSEMQERYQEILEEKKLWKLARHKSPLIRSAVFSLVISSCMKIPSVIQSISSQVCPVILSSLDESEPAVCQHLWGAVLFTLRTVPDSWKQVNIRKAVLPKLWSVLKHGGYGCASVIFPSLLPFISTLPQEIVGSGIGFYQSFFDNLQEGLQELRVQHSPSECAVVMATYMECLCYCLVHSTCQENAWSVKGYLIKDQLLPLIKNSLQPDTKIPTSHLYTALSNLLNFLTNNITMETNVPKDRKSNVTMETSGNQGVAMETSGNQGVAMETNTSKDVSKAIAMECKQAMTNEKLVVEEAEIMLEWFWQGFGSICFDICTKREDEKKLDSPMMDSLANSILGLRSPSTITQKTKKQKVVFFNPKTDSSSMSPGVAPPKTSVITPPRTGVNVDDLYGGQLLDIVCQVCQFCLKEVRNKSSTHLKLLSKLFPDFVSVKLLQVLLEKETENMATLVELCGEFCESVVMPLMVEFGDQRRDLMNVFSLLFGILNSYSKPAQIESLNKVIEVNNSTDFMFALLQKGIDTSLPGMSSWLRSQSASEKIQKLLRMSCRDDNDSDEDSFWRILQIIVANTKTGPLISKSCLDFLMEYLVEMLRKKDGKNLPRILTILHGYFDWCCIQPDDLSTSSEDILLALFLLQFSHPGFEEVLDVWQTGLQAISNQYSGCNVVLVRTSAILTEHLKSADSIDSIVSLSGSAVKLLHAANNLSTRERDMSTTYINKIFHSLVPDVAKCTKWRQKTPKGCWLGSSLCLSMPNISPTPNIQTVNDILNHHHKAVTFITLITKTLLSEPDESLTDIISDSVLVMLYLEAAWINTWCLCVLGCRGLSSSKQLSSHFIQVLPNTNRLQERLSANLQELFDALEKRQVIEILFHETLNKAQNEGWLWTIILDNLIRQLNQKDSSIELSPVLTQLQSTVFDNETSSLNESVENLEAIIQSMVAVIHHANSIYDVKVLTEHSIKYIGQDLTPQEFACVFPLTAASLTKWSKLANGCEEAELEYQLTLIETLDGLIEWKNKHDRMLLLNSSMNDVTPAEVTMNGAVIQIIELVIKDTSKMLNSDHWDFILCALAGWLQTCEENFSSIVTSLLTNSLCQQTFKLLVTISQFFHGLPEHPQEPNKEASDTTESSEANTDEGYPPNLLTEWQEFFRVNMFTTVISMYLKAAEISSVNHLMLSFWTTCESLGLAVTYTPIDVIQNYEFTHVPVGDNTLPLWAQDVLFHFLPLLGCNVHSLQIAAFRLLARVLPELVSCHARKPSADEDESESERSPPIQLMDVINKSLSHMVEILDDAGVPFGTRLCLATDSEALTTSCTLFMSCKLLISFFQKSNVENRPEYATHLKKTKIISNLMSVLFRIIPLDSATVVTEEFDLSISDDVTEQLVQDLGRGLYYSVLHRMPAVVRQWFNGLEKKHATIVDRYTSSAVTPSLCQREMTQVKSSSLQFSNMQVKARPVAGEVAAVYSVDDLSMELVIKLANNHPLGVVTVDSGKKVGVTRSQWRSWILQMTTFLTHQDGSIMDGLVLWKQNADKHFEGVDDCMICFSVIHASNYSLPKLSCKTCKKKFHSICLYRWFSTSNNATCPLCRNIF